MLLVINNCNRLTYGLELIKLTLCCKITVVSEVKKPQFYYDVSSEQVLFGDAAYAAHIEAGGHPADIVSLKTALGDKSVPLVQRHSESKGSTKEDIVMAARWILEIMGHENSSKGLRTHIVRRAHALGLIANDHYIARPDMYGSLRALKTYWTT
jgi:hypothetical protein